MPASTMPEHIFPSGKAFIYKSVGFSLHQDLVSYISYRDSTSPVVPKLAVWHWQVLVIRGIIYIRSGTNHPLLGRGYMVLSPIPHSFKLIYNHMRDIYFRLQQVITLMLFCAALNGLQGSSRFMCSLYCTYVQVQ